MKHDLNAWNDELKSGSAEAILARAFEVFGDRISIAASFSLEDVALIDLAVALSPKVRVFTLDTGRLPQETYDVLDRVRSRYQLEVEAYFPATRAVEELVTLKGPSSFFESPEDRKGCCHIRKVEPLSRALSSSAAWATGLRREQAVTRHDLLPFELDESNGGLVKVSPLCSWSEADVWAYVRANNVPYNKLYDAGYRSIGCAPCTRAVAEGDDVRAGRWWWESPDAKECGLHAIRPQRRGGGHGR